MSRLSRVLPLALALAGCGSSPPVPANVVPQAINGPAIAYRLPVNGEWRVHRTHYGRKDDQATAVDLMKTGSEPRDRKRARNQDYPSYNQPIVADAPGVIAIAVDGVPDNRPWKVNRYDMHGNFVVIDHQNGEYSLFAHLMLGSVRVRPGQPVAAGQEIGRCGNSGGTTHPHLHWQVMNHPHAHEAKGVPIRLLPYNNNGDMTTEPLNKGHVIVFSP